jgi:hypothetical protein
MKKIWWKLRFAFYVNKNCPSCGFWWCYKFAETFFDCDWFPDVYEDGPIYTAREELENWIN